MTSTPSPVPTPTRVPLDEVMNPLFHSPWFWPVVVALFLGLAALALHSSRH